MDLSAHLWSPKKISLAQKSCAFVTCDNGIQWSPLHRPRVALVAPRSLRCHPWSEPIVAGFKHVQRSTAGFLWKLKLGKTLLSTPGESSMYILIIIYLQYIYIQFPIIFSCSYFSHSVMVPFLYRMEYPPWRDPSTTRSPGRPLLAGTDLSALAPGRRPKKKHQWMECDQ